MKLIYTEEQVKALFQLINTLELNNNKNFTNANNLMKIYSILDGGEITKEEMDSSENTTNVPLSI